MLISLKINAHAPGFVWKLAPPQESRLKHHSPQQYVHFGRGLHIFWHPKYQCWLVNSVHIPTNAPLISIMIHYVHYQILSDIIWYYLILSDIIWYHMISYISFLFWKRENMQQKHPTISKNLSISPGVHDSPGGCCQLQRSPSDRCRGSVPRSGPVPGREVMRFAPGCETFRKWPGAQKTPTMTILIEHSNDLWVDDSWWFVRGWY